MGKHIGLALVEAGGNVCLNALADHGVPTHIMPALEWLIQKHIESSITQTLAKNPIILAGLALDNELHNNYWQITFIQEGEQLLLTPHSELQQIMEEMAINVASKLGEQKGYKGATHLKRLLEGAALTKNLLLMKENFLASYQTKLIPHQPRIHKQQQQHSREGEEEPAADDEEPPTPSGRGGAVGMTPPSVAAVTAGSIPAQPLAKGNTYQSAPAPSTSKSPQGLRAFLHRPTRQNLCQNHRQKTSQPG